MPAPLHQIGPRVVMRVILSGATIRAAKRFFFKKNTIILAALRTLRGLWPLRKSLNDGKELFRSRPTQSWCFPNATPSSSGGARNIPPPHPGSSSPLLVAVGRLWRKGSAATSQERSPPLGRWTLGLARARSFLPSLTWDLEGAESRRRASSALRKRRGGPFPPPRVPLGELPRFQAASCHSSRSAQPSSGPAGSSAANGLGRRGKRWSRSPLAVSQDGSLGFLRARRGGRWKINRSGVSQPCENVQVILSSEPCLPLIPLQFFRRQPF